MPGKVSRGSLPRWTATGFSPFARSILEKIDRGVVLLDANSIARQLYAGLSVEETATELLLTLALGPPSFQRLRCHAGCARHPARS